MKLERDYGTYAEDKKRNVTVDYFGISLHFPKAFKYVATDKDGQVHCYMYEPNHGDNQFTGCGVTRKLVDVEFDLEGMDWTDTCIKVDDLIQGKKRRSNLQQVHSQANWAKYFALHPFHEMQINKLVICNRTKILIEEYNDVLEALKHSISIDAAETAKLVREHTKKKVDNES